MSDQRYKNRNWTVAEPNQTTVSCGAAQLAVLLDIRDELQRLNALLHCHNFVGIPTVLRSIRRNTTKPRKRKVSK